jgi:hypothetical protein
LFFFFFPLTNQPRKIPFRKGKEGAIHATLRRREIRRTEISKLADITAHNNKKFLPEK